MAQITRQMLLDNLAQYEKTVDGRNEKAWARMMALLYEASRVGRRSITVSHQGDFSMDELAYIKERLPKEGMRWHWGDSDANMIVIEF